MHKAPQETLFSRERLSVGFKVSLSATHDEAWGLPSRQLFLFSQGGVLGISLKS